jgi:hypothetical protein
MDWNFIFWTAYPLCNYGPINQLQNIDSTTLDSACMPMRVKHLASSEFRGLGDAGHALPRTA